jgi:hypothetical protein
MFVRDMPRLSVDIDLTYLSFHDRATALWEIAATSVVTSRRTAKPPGPSTVPNAHSERSPLSKNRSPVVQ